MVRLVYRGACGSLCYATARPDPHYAVVYPRRPAWEPVLSSVVSPGGTGQPVALASGVEATCHPGTYDFVLQWQQGGWRYQVVDGVSCNTGAGPLLQAARMLMSATGRGQIPVPAMSAGTVVDNMAGGQTSISVIWQVDQWRYRVQGPDTSALSMAASVVHVSGPGAG